MMMQNAAPNLGHQMPAPRPNQARQFNTVTPGQGTRLINNYRSSSCSNRDDAYSPSNHPGGAFSGNQNLNNWNSGSMPFSNHQTDTSNMLNNVSHNQSMCLTTGKGLGRK